MHYEEQGEGYVAGGKGAFYRNQLLEYDPQKNEWTVKLTDSQTLGYSYARAVVANNEAYIFYGDKCQVSKYTPDTNSITELSDFVGLNEERYSAICVLYKGAIYYGVGNYTDNTYGVAMYPQDLWKYEVSDNSGIEKISFSGETAIYPNPVTESFRISGLTNSTLVTISDISGKIVLQSTIAPYEAVSVIHLPKGLYIVQSEGKTVKMIKE